jgi:xylitol oxidase
MSTALANLEAIYSDAYAVYLWTDWGQTEYFTQVWLTSKIGDDNYTDYSLNSTYYGATAAIDDVTPLAALPVPFVATQLGVVDSWHRRLTNYGLGLSGFNGAEIESEYFIRLSNASAAIQALKPLAAQINPIVYVSLIRMIAPDDFWMSQANGDDANEEHSVAIHFTWMLNVPAVMAVLPQIEQALAPFNPVPHWGKLFTMDPCSTFLKHYSKLADFKALDHQLDPTGKFHNAFLNANVFVNCSVSG